MTVLNVKIASQVLVVTVGIIIRGLGAFDWTKDHAAKMEGGRIHPGSFGLAIDLRTVSGVVFIVSGMLSYSFVGVGYEFLVHNMPSERRLSQAQVGLIRNALATAFHA